VAIHFCCSRQGFSAQSGTGEHVGHRASVTHAGEPDAAWPTLPDGMTCRRHGAHSLRGPRFVGEESRIRAWKGEPCTVASQRLEWLHSVSPWS
jgi:hypothetical protein